ncbi:MAG: MBOAT family protein [Ignavibacteriales bacterium]|nr:MBOAT family protein [Ignavibacteriales bacterium]
MSESISPLNVLLLIAYFPKLIAGPLVKAHHFFNQLDSTEGNGKINFAQSASLILKGLFKKFVLANYLALQLVDPIYNNPAQYSSFDILMAIFAFTLQLYWNLSAYSDLAVGFSLLLGIELPRNFNQPFSVQSLSEFWQRWFITFSAWLRDYVYVPIRSRISGNRTKILSILVVFFSGAFWYGTGLNTAFLGLIGAGGVLLEMWMMKRWMHEKVSSKVKVLLTLSVVSFISFLLIFLRSEDLKASIELLSALFRFTYADSILTPLTMSIIIWGFAAHFIPTEWGTTIRNYYTRLHPLTQAVIFGGGILLISTFGLPIEPTFKYFQF